jgi:hypothetical protein
VSTGNQQRKEETKEQVTAVPNERGGVMREKKAESRDREKERQATKRPSNVARLTNCQVVVQNTSASSNRGTKSCDKVRSPVPFYTRDDEDDDSNTTISSRCAQTCPASSHGHCPGTRSSWYPCDRSGHRSRNCRVSRVGEGAGGLDCRCSTLRRHCRTCQ